MSRDLLTATIGLSPRVSNTTKTEFDQFTSYYIFSRCFLKKETCRYQSGHSISRAESNSFSTKSVFWGLKVLYKQYFLLFKYQSFEKLGHSIQLSPKPMRLFPWSQSIGIKYILMGALWVDIVSEMCGIIYSMCWNLSFYPQLWEIYQLKSVAGFSQNIHIFNSWKFIQTSLQNCICNRGGNMSVQYFSLEFALLNPSGYVFYTIYTSTGFIDPTLGSGQVDWQDLFFACHGLCMSTAQLVQCLVYKTNKYFIFSGYDTQQLS